MNYQLTQHAADVVARRGIEADQRDPTLVHHVKTIAEFGGRALRVVFDPNAVPPRVVTVYFDRAVKDLA